MDDIERPLSERLFRAAQTAETRDDPGMSNGTRGVLRDFRELFLEAAAALAEREQGEKVSQND